MLDEARAHPAGGRVADDVRVPGVAAYVAAATGELTEAARLAACAERAADQLGLGDHEPGRIFAGMGLVELHLERHDHEAAARILDEVTRASEASRQAPLRGLVALQNARLARDAGDAGSATARLAEAALVHVAPDLAVRRAVGREAVEQALRFDPSVAEARLAELDQTVVDTKVLRIRLALLDHDDHTARDLLAELPPPTTRRARVERSVLSALCELDRDVEAANRHVHDALTAGRPEHLVRTVVEQGPGVHKLLLSFAPDGAQAPYVDDLLTATTLIVAPASREAGTPLVEPLSSREVTVLRYLCSRLTYREIAAALYVSLNTLKTHVKNVYRKLGVATREDAVTVGRRVGVI